MKQLLINHEELETRVAVVENGRFQDYFIERKDEHHLVGSIFKGVVRNLEPSLQAAFVDIGTEKNAFLHYWDMLPATQDALEVEEDGDEDTDDDAEGTTEPASKTGSVLASLRRHLFTRHAGSKHHKVDKRGKRQEFTVDDIPRLFPVNSEVFVQVTKGPIGTKGARVTTNLSIPGRYLVLLPNSGHVGVSKRIDDRKERERLRSILRKTKLPQGMGLICRTLGAGKKEKVFMQDFDMLMAEWQKLEERSKSHKAPVCVYEEPRIAERILRDYLTEDVDEIVCDSEETHERALELARRFRREKRVKVRLYRGAEPIFEKYRLTKQIDSIYSRVVPLPGGGHICIDETEALIAIDVNTGKNRGGKDHPETILNTNLEAVAEIARQLRLRNLGGLLVLDLIDMRSKADRQTVFKALKQALESDRARTKACPISMLGLVEMTRQREYESVLDTVFDPCPYCDGKGLIKSPKSTSVEIQRRLQTVLRKRKRLAARVTVHPHVLERLKNEDAALLRAMENELGGELSFRADPELHIEEFHVIDMETGREL
jgi:Rne/Rng family ribonuclease